MAFTIIEIEILKPDPLWSVINTIDHDNDVIEIILFGWLFDSWMVQQKRRFRNVVFAPRVFLLDNIPFNTVEVTIVTL